jgi:hypothetical protein
LKYKYEYDIDRKWVKYICTSSYSASYAPLYILDKNGLAEINISVFNENVDFTK